MTAADRAADDARVHRALASEVRVQALDHLRREPDLDTAQLAERLGLHVNTVRAHLAVLEEADLVQAVAEQRDRPGRPRLRYRVTAQAEAAPASDERAYQFLAGILASYLDATVDDSAAAAEAAGTAWGTYLVEKPAPFAQTEPAAAIARIAAMMDEFGFRTEIDDRDPAAPRVLLHRCPFLEVAREHQDLVCAVHLGLMRGALGELAAPVEAEALQPWVTPELCIAHLRTAAD